MKSIAFHFILFFATVLSAQSLMYKQTEKKQFPPTHFSNNSASTLLNVNNISHWTRYDGWSANNPFTGNSGVTFPRGTSTVIYKDGILWGGQVHDTTSPQLRVGGQSYNIGTQSGYIDANHQSVALGKIGRAHV